MAFNAQIARTIIGVIGNIISCCLFLSPAPTFLRIFKNKSVEEFSPYPYLAAAMNCVFWIFYGLPFNTSNNVLVITINVAGLVLEILYITLFYMYGDNKKRKLMTLMLLVEAVIFAVVASVTLTKYHTHEERGFFVGIFCVIFGICMYAAPLSVMWSVIKTKSVEYMPFLLSFASFMNGLIWVVYAFLQFDLNIIIANGVGVVLAIIQLGLWIFIGRIYPWCFASDSSRTDVEMVPPKVNNIV